MEEKKLEKNLENRKERYNFVTVASGSNSPQDHPGLHCGFSPLTHF